MLDELDLFLGDEDLDENTLNKYREAYIRQYTNLKYEILDSKTQGNKSDVDVRISVFDYYDVNNNVNDMLIENKAMFIDKYGDIDLNLFLNYKIDKLLNTNKRVDYDLELHLKKYNNIWEIEPLTTEQLNKIHGTYEY